MRMEKRQRCNHSASLGKTLARAQQLQHLSYAEPREFDLSHHDSKSLSKNPGREPASTPKPPPSVPAGICAGEGVLAAHLARMRCGQLSGDVHAASMAKSLRVNRMYKELHHFGVCVDELRWLLGEGDALLRAYLQQAQLIAPLSTHTHDVANIAHEFRALLLRFKQIDREQLAGMEEFLRAGAGVEGRALQTFPDVHSVLSVKGEEPSFLETRHFSVPLKENMNTSNLPHFDNIKITKTETAKANRPDFKTKPQQPPMVQSVTLPVSETAELERERAREREHQRQEAHQREKDDLYKKLRQEHERCEALAGSVELLKEEVSSLERKLTTYKVASTKSIEKLGGILQRLSTPLTDHDREAELLRAAQVVAAWDKLIADDLHEAKYRQLYGHPEAMQGEKTTRLREIIELQYDINDLMAQRQQLHRTLQAYEQGAEREQLYRMLLMQASAVEQLTGLG